MLGTALAPVPGMLEPTFLSRSQFAWTITIHIIFASLSVGLAPFIVYFTWKDVRTGSQRYARLREFWVTVFAIGFVMGTATGIPMSFQFGTNFPIFSEVTGELIGGPLAFEAKMAFFLEAVFLGILLFGRERVSDRTYVLSSVLVAVGAWLSAFWIIVVNAWMQTPQGYELVDGGSGLEVATMTDPVAALLTPRLPWMYAHMQLSAVIAVALLIAGIAAYFIWHNRDSKVWRTALMIAIVVLIVTAPLQALQGDAYARHVEDTQPAKFAAMEAHYETQTGADLHIVAFPNSLDGLTDPRAENLWTISIPELASVLTGGDADTEVTGLNEFEDTPPVAVVFWSFRVMVGLGIWFIALSLWAGYRAYRGQLTESNRLLAAFMLSTPLGFIAMISGWYTTEVGRQPWIVQDILTVEEGVSETLSTTEALLSFVAFFIVYTLLFLIFVYVIWRIMGRERERIESVAATESADTDPGTTADAATDGGANTARRDDEDAPEQPNIGDEATEGTHK